jgi:lupus La protein
MSTEQPSSELSELDQAILKQVEYYFSDQNLVKDTFLRRHISADPNHFVPLSLLITFNKLKSLSTDVNVISAALKQSKELVLSEDGLSVKRPGELPSRKVQVKDKVFEGREELYNFYSAIFRKYNPEETLSEEDKEYLLGLVGFHKNAQQKLGSGVVSVKLGHNPKFPQTNCFVLIRSDATEEDFSYIKCINGLFPKDRPDLNKPKKNSKQKQPSDTPSDATERTFTPGCVVQVHEIPPDGVITREVLKEHYGNFGDVKYVCFQKSQSDRAYIRFNDPVEAKKALESEFQLNEKVFKQSLLEGEEEKKYYENMWKEQELKRKNFSGKRGKGRMFKKKKTK